MLQRTFECEVLTPLFLGGAQARGTPELRAPSLRGAMRYWYRALLGGSSSPTLASLHEAESALFGRAEVGGALSTRLRPKGAPQTHPYEKDRAIRTANGDYLPTGRDYLLWSMSSAGKPDTPRFQPARHYIEPGTKFDFILSTKLEESSLKAGEAAFWLLANLGSVGARANRGAGSFQALGSEASLPFKTSASISELRSHLQAGIQACLEQVGGQWNDFSPDEQAEYDLLHPQFCKVWIVAAAKEGWGSHREALEGLGSHFRDFRTHLHPLGKSDHDAVLHWFERGSKAPQLKRPVFGLPIPFRYSQGGPADVIIHEEGDRRGSPLHIRLTRLSNGRHVGVLTLFMSRFLPEDTNLKLQERKWKASPPPDYQVILDFIQTFPIKEKVSL